jgi:hypothetical protein
MNEQFFEVANKLGWNADTQVMILLQYVERQQSNETFENFLAECIQQDEQDSNF